uniref:SprT-like domain-containing protein n=1 Tax=Colletotrichum fructicola (strain Nara gc5) TaxID=1213859 RepID=L2FI95_COLFN
MSAPQAQRQVPAPVQSIQPCNHATFPRAIRRGAEEVVPDDRPEWPLQVHSYGARDLLNKTVAGFLHDKLTARQKAAQDGFHKRFKDGSSMAAILDTRPALAGKSPPLRDLMRFLDDRFFFGSMTRRGLPTVQLLTGYSHLGVGEEGKLGDARQKGENLVVIRLFSSWRDLSVPHRTIVKGEWSNIVGVLIHEMVHAYLFLFLCKGQTCERNRLNTYGVTGHGPVFTSLLALIIREIRSWHSDLTNLYASHFDAVTGADWRSWDLETSARIQQWRVYKSKGYRPFQEFVGRDLVECLLNNDLDGELSLQEYDNDDMEYGGDMDNH